MKKYILTLILGLFTFVGFSQYTLFSENIGTSTGGSGTPGTLSLASTTFQNTSFVFSGTADTRKNVTSSGYVGSSGSRNVFINSGKNFIISGINTSNLFLMTLSLGQYKDLIGTSNELTIEVSNNGGSYTPLSYTRPTGSGTANWTLITPSGTIPSSTNLSLRFTNTTATGQFRIDDIKLTYQTALPITLMSFTAQKVENSNLLEWITASEINNDYFLLERSIDGIIWRTINKSSGAGNSNTLINYSFSDYDFENTINYYRLSQVDYDGASETFDIIDVNNNIKSKKILNIINTNGQEVTIDTKGLLIITYEDGSTMRIMN
jgi:hypothetical protein